MLEQNGSDDIQMIAESSSFHRVLDRGSGGSSTLLAGFNRLLETNFGVDALLRPSYSEDREEFRAHRLVLAAVSPFLQQKFVRNPDISDVIPLPVDAKRLRQIIDLIYGKRVTLVSSQEEEDLFGAYRHLNLTLGEPLDSQVYQSVDVKPSNLSSKVKAENQCSSPMKVTFRADPANLNYSSIETQTSRSSDTLPASLSVLSNGSPSRAISNQVLTIRPLNGNPSNDMVQRCRPIQLPKREPEESGSGTGQTHCAPGSAVSQPKVAAAATTLYRPTASSAPQQVGLEEKYTPVTGPVQLVRPQPIPTKTSTPYDDSHGQWLQCHLFDVTDDFDPFRKLYQGDGLLTPIKTGDHWLLQFKDSQSAKDFLIVNEVSLKSGTGFKGLEAVPRERPWSLKMIMENRDFITEPKNITRHFVKNRFRLHAVPIVHPGPAFEIPFSNLSDAEEAFRRYNGKKYNEEQIASLQFKPFCGF